MSYSYAVSETTSFTRTHARHIAAKVATDLKRMQRFYGKPSDSWIDAYQKEVVEFLKEGLLETVTYGFKRDGAWTEPTLCYTSRDLLGVNGIDDDPGRIRPGAQISGASFYSYLTYNAEWSRLTPEQRMEFTKRLPFRRTAGKEPSANGYWHRDLAYSAGGRSLDRASLKRYQ